VRLGDGLAPVLPCVLALRELHSAPAHLRLDLGRQHFPLDACEQARLDHVPLDGYFAITPPAVQAVAAGVALSIANHDVSAALAALKLLNRYFGPRPVRFAVLVESPRFMRAPIVSACCRWRAFTRSQRRCGTILSRSLDRTTQSDLGFGTRRRRLESAAERTHWKRLPMTGELANKV
jgi:hypothetical protein